MHDQTYISPILDDLKLLINQGCTQISIGIGEFTNLSKEKILHFLSINLNTANVTFDFVKINGNIQCYECGYEGVPGKIFADKHSHSEVKTSCLNCNSLNTIKKSGDRLLINPK